MTAFAELVAASNYSFLHGASHPSDMVAQAVALGMNGIGIADEFVRPDAGAVDDGVRFGDGVGQRRHGRQHDLAACRLEPGQEVVEVAGHVDQRDGSPVSPDEALGQLLLTASVQVGDQLGLGRDDVAEVDPRRHAAGGQVHAGVLVARQRGELGVREGGPVQDSFRWFEPRWAPHRPGDRRGRLAGPLSGADPHLPTRFGQHDPAGQAVHARADHEYRTHPSDASSPVVGRNAERPRVHPAAGQPS